MICKANPLFFLALVVFLFAPCAARTDSSKAVSASAKAGDTLKAAAKIDSSAARDTLKAAAKTDSSAAAGDSLPAAVKADSSARDSAAAADKTQKAGAPLPAVEEEELSIESGKASDYRSPTRAMFYSLLVPGLGQYYGRSAIKAVAFVLVEATSFILQHNYNRQGDDKEQEFHTYTDQHFSDSAYGAWHKWVEPNYSTNTAGVDSIYIMHDETYIEFSREKGRDYYELVSKYNQFVNGWDDMRPRLANMDNGTNESVIDSVEGKPIYKTKDFLAIIDGDTSLGFSRHQLTAMDMSAESNHLYRNADNLWFVLLANHVCSAVDAAFTAVRYNRTLLGQKHSVLDRIHFQGKTISGIQGPVGVATIQIRF